MIIRKFGSFLGVGALATGIHYAVLMLLVEVFGAAPVPSSAIGFALSSVVNYALNYHITFRSSNPHRVAFARFVLVAVVGLLLNTGLLAVLVEGAGLHYLMSQVAATIVVLFWNFFLNLAWSFRSTNPVRTASTPLNLEERSQ